MKMMTMIKMRTATASPAYIAALPASTCLTATVVCTVCPDKIDQHRFVHNFDKFEFLANNI